MSKDVANTLATYQNDNTSNEDVLSSSYLKKFVHLSGVDPNRMCYLVEDSNNKIPNCDNILYFRVKNKDRNIDVAIFKELLDRIYNIYA